MPVPTKRDRELARICVPDALIFAETPEHLAHWRKKAAQHIADHHARHVGAVAIEQAALYVLDRSRRSNASLNDEQREADTGALMAAYRDIITKAVSSGYLGLYAGGLEAAASWVED